MNTQNNKTNQTGNISNQRYEIQSRMKRFLKVLTQSRPNKETTDWKNPRPQIVNDKRAEQRSSHRQRLDFENDRIRQNLLKILNETRESTTNEFCPGYRHGKCGMVIDCYASKNCNAEKFRILHGRGKEIERKTKALEEKNAEMQRHLENIKPVLRTIDCVDEYNVKMKLRVKKVSRTALHLGLLKEVVKERATSAVPTFATQACRPSSANSYLQGSSAGSAARSRSNSPTYNKSRPSSSSSSAIPMNSSNSPIKFENASNALLSFKPQTIGMEKAAPVRKVPKIIDIVDNLQRRLCKTVSSIGKSEDSKKSSSSVRYKISSVKKNKIIPIEKDETNDDNHTETEAVSDAGSRTESYRMPSANYSHPAAADTIIQHHSLHAVHTSYHDHDDPAHSAAAITFGSSSAKKGKQQQESSPDQSPRIQAHVGYSDEYSLDFDNDDVHAAAATGLSMEEAKAVKEITSALEQCLKDS